MTAPRPRQRANRMYMSADDFCNSAGQKVPDNNASIVAADSEQRSVFVEAARDSQGDAIKRTVVLFREVLTKRFCKGNRGI